MGWFFPKIRCRPKKKNLHVCENWFSTQFSLRFTLINKVFAGLELGFSRNRLTFDILHQIIRGAKENFGGKNNKFRQKMHEILWKWRLSKIIWEGKAKF